MQWLREWGLAVCTVSVFGAGITLLSPEDRYEKLLNMCVSLFLLVAVITPMTKLDSCCFDEISSAEVEYEYNSGELEHCIEEQTCKYLASTARTLIEAHLAEKGISAEEISVVMDSSENGSISIGQVTIMLGCDDTVSCEAVRQDITNLLGSDNVQVAVGGTNG